MRVYLALKRNSDFFDPRYLQVRALERLTDCRHVIGVRAHLYNAMSDVHAIVMEVRGTPTARLKLRITEFYLYTHSFIAYLYRYELVRVWLHSTPCPAGGRGLRAPLACARCREHERGAGPPRLPPDALWGEGDARPRRRALRPEARECRLRRARHAPLVRYV